MSIEITKEMKLALKEEIKKSAQASRDLMTQIQTLKWGSMENAKKVRELKKVKGTRAERKALRHPETGAERASLWCDKRDHKETSRYLLLAYAFIRGRSYRSQERKCKELPSASYIAHVAANYAKGTSKEAIEAWLAAEQAEVRAA
jgi:hypothetical protein